MIVDRKKQSWIDNHQSTIQKEALMLTEDAKKLKEEKSKKAAEAKEKEKEKEKDKPKK
jgi:hypothetical protein